MQAAFPRIPPVAVALLASALFLPLAAADVKEAETGESFADTMGDTKLGILGTGVREKMWVNVYACAFYADHAALKPLLKAYVGKDADDLEDTQAFFDDLCKVAIAKHLRLKLVRNVDVATMKQAFVDGITATMKPGPDADLLLGALTKDLKTGDVIDFTFGAAGEITLQAAGGAVKSAKNKALAEALLKIWLGESPVAPTLKTDVAAGAAKLLK
jgi:hypothetical protein